MSPPDLNALIQKLPHRGSMRLLDSVESVTERTATTFTEIDAARATLFCGESYVGVELIAQSAALPLILTSEPGKEHAGMIVQLRSFSSHFESLPLGSMLKTDCEVELLMDDKIAAVRGTVTWGGNLVCEAAITLAIQSS